jgi:hypothetical protein
MANLRRCQLDAFISGLLRRNIERTPTYIEIGVYLSHAKVANQAISVKIFPMWHKNNIAGPSTVLAARTGIAAPAFVRVLTSTVDLGPTGGTEGTDDPKAEERQAGGLGHGRRA